jgi:hypothetical protein
MSQPRIRITSIGGSEEGLSGEPGASAYQVALNNGFSGTEQDWLDSLVGPPGGDGADGDPLDFLNVPSNIIPDADNTHTLGTTEKRWKDIYIGPGKINITDQTLDTDATITVDNGILFINGIAQAQLENILVTNLTFADDTTQTTAAVPQVNSDWNSTSGLSEILNKPAIPTDINQLEDVDNLLDAGITYASVLQHSVKAGESLTKGQAVYASSADGTNIIVSKASNATEQTSSKTMGLISSTLSTNGQGTVVTEGILSGLNTSTANAGDPVWLGTNGNLVYGLANKPVAPAHLVFIGIVTRANQNNGEIFIRPQNGFELNEIHDVLIGSGYGSTPTDKDLLAYESSSGLWKNKTFSQLGIQIRVSGVTDTEIGYLDGVSSSIQSQLNTKQDVVGNVSSTEIGYLDGVTSGIQGQLNFKADMLSPIITMASFASANSSVDPVTISTGNGHGGSGYAGLITFENTASGATNSKKYIRMNNQGSFEIINNAYSATIFQVTDSGNINASGTYNGAYIGDTGWISVTSFNNNFSGGSVAYRRINGVVYLRGRVSGGTAGSGAFVLPEGFRPSAIEVVIPTQQYGTANINYTSVGNDGNVVPNASSAWLSSISFPVN